MRKERTIHIEPEALRRAFCEDKNKIKYIDAKDIYTPPYEIKPIDGYEPVEGYPNCCNSHKSLYKRVKEYIRIFPNCCERHKRLLKRADFDIEHYSDFPEHFMNVLSYTIYHIQNRINNEDWFEDITEYIEYAIPSFGQPETYVQNYLEQVKHYINKAEGSDKVDSYKKVALIEYIDSLSKPIVLPPPDINALRAIYTKWLKLFPFDLFFFEPLRGHFSTTLPLLAEEPKVNRYSKMARAKIISSEPLIKHLVEQTRIILKSVNTQELYEEGKITLDKKQRLDVVNAEHRIGTEELLGEYSKGEMKYVTTIKKWLSNEKEYYKELAEITSKKETTSEPTKAEKLNHGLYKYGFQEIQKVKDLNETSTQKLIEKIAESSLPYKVAMLSYLGFFEYLLKEHFTSKFQMFKSLSCYLGGDNRAIKGNINILNPKSKESKHKYTSYQQKETVEKDYKSLKKGVPPYFSP